MSILECFGQAGAIGRLQRARNAQRVPHGYIFHGPEGVGKGLLARQWAKLLLCGRPRRRAWPDQGIGIHHAGRDGEIDDCCDSCDDCRLAEAETHPDLHIINKNLAKYLPPGKLKQISLSIDVIREFVIKPAGVFPIRNRARVFIIEQADSMKREAQNALLKTLEEPPASTFLILLTTRPNWFLPTVRSRCQSVRLVRLPKDFIYNKLRESGADEAQARYWADFSEGRLGRALKLAGMDIYDKKCELVGLLGQLDYGKALSLAAWITNQAKEFGRSWCNDHPDDTTTAAERRGYICWLEIIAHVYSCALRFATAVDMGRPNGFDQPEEIGIIAQKWDFWGCAEVIRATNRARGRLEANVNQALLLESLLLEYIKYE